MTTVASDKGRQAMGLDEHNMTDTNLFIGLGINATEGIEYRVHTPSPVAMGVCLNCYKHFR